MADDQEDKRNMDASLLNFTRARWMRLALVVGLLALALGGCGRGDEEVQDDPTMNDPGLEDIDDSPSERSFEDDQNIPFDRDTPDPSDMRPDALPPQVKDVFFGYDKYELDAESRAVLQENARLIRDLDVSIMVEGHCDERGTAQYNMALGWKRANEVMRYLVSLGVSSDRMQTVSYGKERPFVAGEGEEIWAQNRRAHFRLQEEGR
jgi:peptidoglycan-associated lipoprotein